MTVSVCNITVNANGEEIEQHGTALFPISHFQDDLSKITIPWHWHEDFEIIWAVSGSIKVLVGANEHLVPQGDGIFVNAGMLHALEPGSQGHCQCRSIVFHPRLIGSMDSIFWQDYVETIIQNRNLPLILLDSASDWKRKVLTLSNSVWERLFHRKDWYQLYVRNELSELLLFILKNLSVCEIKPDIKKARNSRRIKVMLHYIHTHFSEEIFLANLAQEALISESEVLRCFHSILHTTPNQYLKQYRLQKAAALLADTTLSVLEIALSCGFQSSSYFSKSFKEKMGCTPQSFRKQTLNVSPSSL